MRESSRLRLVVGADEVAVVHHVLRADPSVPRVMLDVGAHVGSTCRAFARDGFAVHAFEPDPDNRRHLLEVARRYPSMVVDPRAVSDVSGADLTFYRSSEASGISGLSPFSPSHVAAGHVRTVTLADYCVAAGLGRIGFLKVDVEGFDLIVLRGVDWEAVHPDVVVAEFHDEKTVPLGYDLRDLCAFLDDRGYVVIVSEWYPIVRYGGPHRFRRFARWPTRLLDPRAMGNVIAVRRPEHVIAFERAIAALAPLWRTVTALRHVVRI